MRTLIFILACLLLIIPCQARTITVDYSDPAAFDNIQAAIDDSSTGDIVEVRPGTYTGIGNRDIDFGGRAITVRSTDPNNHQIVDSTIIDCQGAGRGFVFHTGEGAESVIAGLTIINGYDSFIAGAIRCYSSSSPTVSNCVISDNSAMTYGGGISCESGSNPVISNCVIKNNSVSYGFGGGVFCDAGSPTIRNTLITGNTAVIGGGISCAASNAVLRNCTLRGNTGSSQGGGIYCSNSSDVTVENSILWGDTSSKGPEIVVSKSGGASSLTVSYCDVQGGEQAAVVEQDCTLNWGSENIDDDPCFATGLLGDSYLSQTAADQLWDSPCVDAGSGLAANLGLDEFTTRTDGLGDLDIVDMGYHYPSSSEQPAISAGIDIKPGTINLASKARWINCFIRLPEGYNVADIQTASIVFPGEEIKAEGISVDEAEQVAMARFSRSQLQANLGIGDSVTVTVSGELAGGTIFEGTDTIRVIGKGGKKK